jgi:alpha-N-acetylglucosamine transferase
MNNHLGQGYLTLAMGAQKYVEMAVVLGLSLKTFDPKRPVCLLHDKHVMLPAYAERIFDQTILVSDDTKYTGCMNKARLYDYSPFERTMFVDADCILMKSPTVF